jgi:hypothetical protein
MFWHFGGLFHTFLRRARYVGLTDPPGLHVKQVALRYLAASRIPQRSFLRFGPAAFHPDSNPSSSNPRVPIKGLAVRHRYQAQSVVPKRHAPTPHRDHLRARATGRNAEKPRT